MDERDWLAKRFEEHRSHLRAVAYRILGSVEEAEDAVQDAWLRLNRSETEGVKNFGGWLTTVVARVALNKLRSQRRRREESFEAGTADRDMDLRPRGGPEQEALLASSVGLAMFVVLEAMPPAERVVFVLHDMFELPFNEIARVVGRSPAATRKLASRARRRVRGSPSVDDAELARQRQLADAFLGAARDGYFERLLALLDPGIVLRVDAVAAGAAEPIEVRGAEEVTRRALAFKRRAAFTQPALLDGSVGLIFAPYGRLRLALIFEFVNGKIGAMDVVADPRRLRTLRLGALERLEQ